VDRNFKRACSRGGTNGAQSCAMGRNFGFEIVKFQSAFGVPLATCFRNAVSVRRAVKRKPISA